MRALGTHVQTVCNSYVVAIIDLFYENENNYHETISRQILNYVDIKSLLNGYDVLIVDRGFHYVISLLNSDGYEAKMHSYMPKEETQHSVSSANADRLCNKTHWVVES